MARRWAPGAALVVAAALLVLLPLLVLLRAALEEGLGPLLEAVESAGAAISQLRRIGPKPASTST